MRGRGNRGMGVRGRSEKLFYCKDHVVMSE